MTAEEKRERDRRAWKRSVKAIVGQIICCGDPDVVVTGETAHAVHVMCGECQGHSVITQPGF
jgi:hypothetical protein